MKMLSRDLSINTVQLQNLRSTENFRCDILPCCTCAKVYFALNVWSDGVATCKVVASEVFCSVSICYCGSQRYWIRIGRLGPVLLYHGLPTECLVQEGSKAVLISFSICFLETFQQNLGWNKRPNRFSIFLVRNSG